MSIQKQFEAGVELDAFTRNLMRTHRCSYSDGLRMAVAANPKLGSEYTGTQVPNGGFQRVYDRELQQDPDAVWTVSVGEIVSAAKKASAVAKIPLQDAIRRILQSETEAAKKVAGDWLSAKAITAINNLNIQGATLDQTFPVGLRVVTRQFPEVNAMWDSGVVSDLALRTIFTQWFK
jgi:hypothetical protein